MLSCINRISAANMVISMSTANDTSTQFLELHKGDSGALNGDLACSCHSMVVFASGLLSYREVSRNGIDEHRQEKDGDLL
jgi:hypothetical protein